MVTFAPLQTFAGFLPLAPPVVTQRLTQVKEPFAAWALQADSLLCAMTYSTAQSIAVLPVKGGNYQLSGKVAQSLQSQSISTGYFGIL